MRRVVFIEAMLSPSHVIGHLLPNDAAGEGNEGPTVVSVSLPCVERTVKMTTSPSVCDDYHVVRETTPGTAVVWRIQLALTVTQATDTAGAGMVPPRCCN